MIGLLEKLAQARGGTILASLVQLVRKESRVVSNFVYIETKSPINNTKHFIHETNIVFHDSIL